MDACTCSRLHYRERHSSCGGFSTFIPSKNNPLLWSGRNYPSGLLAADTTLRKGPQKGKSEACILSVSSKNTQDILGPRQLTFPNSKVRKAKEEGPQEVRLKKKVRITLLRNLNAMHGAWASAISAREPQKTFLRYVPTTTGFVM